MTNKETAYLRRITKRAKRRVKRALGRKLRPMEIVALKQRMAGQ